MCADGGLARAKILTGTSLKAAHGLRLGRAVAAYRFATKHVR